MSASDVVTSTTDVVGLATMVGRAGEVVGGLLVVAVGAVEDVGVAEEVGTGPPVVATVAPVVTDDPPEQPTTISRPTAPPSNDRPVTPGTVLPTPAAPAP